MKTSTEIKQITAAFLKAQKKIKGVIKDKTNPFYNQKYADLEGVISTCKDELNNEEIIVMQPIDGLVVETILIHSSGEWFSSSTPIVSKDPNDPQKLGSAITYAKRYGLQSMVLIPSEDDDANQATKAPPKPGMKLVSADKIKGVEQIDPAWISEDDIPNAPPRDEHFCTIHNKPMKERTAKNGGHYYDHRWTDDTGKWSTCNGKETK